MGSSPQGNLGSGGPLFPGPGSPRLPGEREPASPMSGARPIAPLPVAPNWAVQPPPLPQQAARTRSWALLTIVAVVVVGLGVIAWAMLSGWIKLPPGLGGRHPPPFPSESDWAEPDGSGAIWPGAGTPTTGPDGAAEVPVPEDVRRDIVAAVERLAAAMRASDGEAAADCLDIDGITSELIRRMPAMKLSAREQRDFRVGLRAGLRRLPEFLDPAGGFIRPEVRRIRLLGDRRFAVVYVRLWTEDGIDTKQRIFMRRSSAGWLVYDMEDLSVGLTMLTAMSSVFPRAMSDPSSVQESGQKLRDLCLRMREKDFERADVLLKDLERRRLPDEIQGIVRMLRCAERVQRGEFKQALEAADQADRLRPDMPLLDLLRAQAWLGLGNHDFCLAHADKFAALLGEDYSVLWLRGQVAAAQGRPGQARDYFLRSLDDNPNQPELLVNLAAVLPEGDKAELARRFARLPNPQEWFATVGMGLRDAWDTEGLLVLVEAHRRMKPDDLAIDYFLAWVDLRQKRPEQAADRMRRAVPRVSDQVEQQAYIDLFVEAMCAMNQPVQAYRQMPHPDYTFIHVAESVRFELDALEAVVAAHRERSPGHAWLGFYQAQVHLGRKQPDQAVLLLDKMWAVPLNEEDRETVRDWLTLALYRSGRGPEAYRRLPPKDATFDQLGWLYYGDDDAAGLEGLIELHRKDSPADPALPFWQADVAMLRKDYEKVVAILGAAGKGVPEELTWRHEDRMIRALLRLSRGREALLLAKESTARDGDPYWEAIVYAVQGDVQRTIELVGRLVEEHGYDLEEFYEDADAGPALRSPGAAGFRKAHPEPGTTLPTTQAD